MKIKTYIIIILSLLPFYTWAQHTIKGKIVEADTKEPVAYSNVFNLTIKNGVISNADGDFSIQAQSLNDTIVISYIGFEKQYLTAKQLKNTGIVALKKKVYELHEIEVYSNNDYLYDILSKCRKIIKKSYAEQTSKAVYVLNTSIDNSQPLEFLECYYNAQQTNGKIMDLRLKNGRSAVLAADSSHFRNFNTSKVYAKLSLIYKNESFPTIPLQLKKRRMKQAFELHITEPNREVYKIAFIPKKIKGNYEGFTGEVWVDKQSHCIRKLTLKKENATQHPFEAFGNYSHIQNLDFDISILFDEVNSSIRLRHIAFNMAMTYHANRTKEYRHKAKKDIQRKIKIKSFLYCYDFQSPFILPYFDYPNIYHDYWHLSVIPYNPVFWTSKKVLLTQQQLNSIDFLKKNGNTINFKNQKVTDIPMDYHSNNSYGIKNMSPNRVSNNAYYSHFTYVPWSANDRVFIPHAYQKNHHEVKISQAPIDNYKLEVQILLDINPLEDTYDCKSHTIFDGVKTYYYLERDMITDVFVNIYFDICEMERRKMEKELEKHHSTLQEINAIYQETLSNIKKITYQYQKDVDRGHHFKKLERWNEYVRNELDIDNFKIFGLN